MEYYFLYFLFALFDLLNGIKLISTTNLTGNKIVSFIYVQPESFILFIELSL